MAGAGDGARLLRGKAWRWGFYAISFALALSELIIGLTAQQRGEWLLPWVVSYALWILTFLIFIGSCLIASPQRFVLYEFTHAIAFHLLEVGDTLMYLSWHRSCFGYLICTAVTMYFFNTIGATSEENLYKWIPLATNGGVFVGIGTKDLLSWLWTCIHNLLLRLFQAVMQGDDSFELPFHIYSTSSATTTHRRPYPPSPNAAHDDFLTHVNGRSSSRTRTRTDPRIQAHNARPDRGTTGDVAEFPQRAQQA